MTLSTHGTVAPYLDLRDPKNANLLALVDGNPDDVGNVQKQLSNPESPLRKLMTALVSIQQAIKAVEERMQALQAGGKIPSADDAAAAQAYQDALDKSRRNNELDAQKEALVTAHPHTMDEKTYAELQQLHIELHQLHQNLTHVAQQIAQVKKGQQQAQTQIADLTATQVEHIKAALMKGGVMAAGAAVGAKLVDAINAVVGKAVAATHEEMDREAATSNAVEPSAPAASEVIVPAAKKPELDDAARAVEAASVVSAIPTPSRPFAIPTPERPAASRSRRELLDLMQKAVDSAGLVLTPQLVEEVVAQLVVDMSQKFRPVMQRQRTMAAEHRGFMDMVTELQASQFAITRQIASMGPAALVRAHTAPVERMTDVAFRHHKHVGEEHVLPTDFNVKEFRK